MCSMILIFMREMFCLCCLSALISSSSAKKQVNEILKVRLQLKKQTNTNTNTHECVYRCPSSHVREFVYARAFVHEL